MSMPGGHMLQRSQRPQERLAVCIVLKAATNGERGHRAYE
jgi:hypothetical protein